MFQTIQDSKPKRTLFGSIVLLWRSTLFRYGLVCLLGVAVVAGSYGYYVWGQMISVDCQKSVAPKLSISQLIELRERLGFYQQERAYDASLSLSAYELGFIVWTKTDIVGDYSVEGENLEAKLTLPRDDGTCYKLDFLGQLNVHKGRIEVRPQRLIVGEADLTWWFQPSYSMDSRSFGEVAEATCSNIDGITFSDGEVQVRLRNRTEIW
jgi:hypothetical protein